MASLSSDDDDAASALARRDGRGAIAAWLGLAGLAMLAYAAVLPGTFVLDANTAIAASSCVTGSLDLPRIFGSDFWCGGGVGSYRPIPVLAWWSAWHLGAGRPLAFHLLSMALHVSCTLLLVRVGLALGFPRVGVLLSAAWFAVMPIHVDAVASMVGQADLWSSVGVLLTLDALLRRRATAPLWAGLAVFSKETGVIVLPLCWLLARFGPGGNRIRMRDPKLWAIALVTFGMLGARFAVLGSLTATEIAHEVNPLVGLPWLDRFPASLDLVRRYQQLAILGGPMSADYSFAAIGVGPHVSSVGAVVGGLTVVAWTAHLAAPNADPGRRSSTLWFLGAILLISNLPFLLLAMFAERLFYGASIPFCLLLGTTVAKRLRSRAAWAAAIAYLSVQLGSAMHHASRWTTEDRLTEWTVRQVPESATARVWRARQLLRDGLAAPAAEHARAALEIDTGAAAAYALWATALDLQGAPEDALQLFMRGFEQDPAHPEVADLFVQFLRRYGHDEQAAWVRMQHERARGGHREPGLLDGARAR